MALKLKNEFRDYGNHIGPDGEAGLESAWAVWADHSDFVEIWMLGCAARFRTVSVDLGQSWHEAAHKGFVANGWTSPWEEA